MTYQLTVIQAPSGRFIFVGSVPLELMKTRQPTQSDTMAGRVIDGKVYTSKAFDTAQEALTAAEAIGVKAELPRV